MTRVSVLILASAGALGAFVLVWQIIPAQYRPPVEFPAAAMMRVNPAHELDGRVSADGHGARTSPDGHTSVLASANETAAALTAAVGKEPARIGSTNDAPAFDVARVEPNGEAVIAGRTAPGGTVELLRDGEVHDQTTANQSGEFVLIPRRLPPGNYDLTLRSKRPDGEQAVSKNSIAVVLRPASTVTPRPAVAEDRSRSQPAAAPTSGPAEMEALKSEAQPVAARADRKTDVVVAPKVETTVVSHGDSLWRISRSTYGKGVRYSAIFNANQNQIRDPNRIYPGQVFVLPNDMRD